MSNIMSGILIQGESGTGKELIAKAIHYNSMKKNKPFVAVNCAAIPEGLLESELFGYVKGAFTGANANKKGLFEMANTGTIFLDEVETMSGNLQAKLLRVLQDLTFFKVGGTTPITVDVRVIAATMKDLKEMVKSEKFREDLYYRLNVIKIALPPLKERMEDIPLLVRFFIKKFNKKMGKNIRKISDTSMAALISHSWISPTLSSANRPSTTSAFMVITLLLSVRLILPTRGLAVRLTKLPSGTWPAVV